MNWPCICSAVIPCLNEAATVGQVVREVSEHLPSVIIVDDGSTDGTARLAEAAGALVIRHSQPRGKGTAVRNGWRAAQELGFHWVLCMDGDRQHAPSEIPVLCAAAERTGASMVVGNRMANPAGMPWLRRHVNQWMSRQLSRLSGRSLPDSQSGFRLINLDFWDPEATFATHFEIESDVLLAYLMAGHRVEFVPVAAIYDREQSKIHPVRDTFRWFRWKRKATQRFKDCRGNA